MYHDTLAHIHFKLFSIMRGSIQGVINGIVIRLLIHDFLPSHLTRLIVYHLHAICDFTRELYKLLVRWVLVHVVVSVLCVLKLDHEAVCMRILGRALVMVLVGYWRHTA